MKAAILALLLAAPASADIISEWHDLQARCGQAVESGAALDLAGLEPRAPTVTYDRQITDGTRRYIAANPARLSGRVVPRGIWGMPGGRFELRLIEYPTRPGTRTICEIIIARGTEPLTEAEGTALLAAFDTMRTEATAGGGWHRADLADDATTTREGMERNVVNRRGCPVIASVTVNAPRAYFRSAVSEKAGIPSCGGVSLFPGGRLDL